MHHSTKEQPKPQEVSSDKQVGRSQSGVTRTVALVNRANVLSRFTRVIRTVPVRNAREFLEVKGFEAIQAVRAAGIFYRWDEDTTRLLREKKAKNDVNQVAHGDNSYFFAAGTGLGRLDWSEPTRPFFKN